MHEYSIVQALIDQCENEAKKNNAKSVTKVVAKIGVLSGVEIDLLKTAFDTFKEETVCKNAEFIINHQKVVIECHECNSTSTLEQNEFACPKCESTNLTVTDGEDMYLMSLEME